MGSDYIGCYLAPQPFGAAADIEGCERNRRTPRSRRRPPSLADASNNVVGYELRFRGAVDLGDPSRDAKATSALLIEAFGDIGLERLEA